MNPSLRHLVRTLPTSLIFLLAPISSAQIGSDECVAADAVSGVGVFPFDTNLPTDTGVPATTSVEQQCGDLTNDIWIDWEAPVALDGHILRFDTCGSTFESEIGVWRGTCASMVGLGCNEFSPSCGGSGGAVEITAVGGEHYPIQIGFYSFSGFEWGSGNLTVTDLGPDPCLSTPPDAFEDNDDCTSAAPIGAGSYPGLAVTRDDGDFYRITVPAGFRITCTAADDGPIFQSDFRLFLTDAICEAQHSVSANNDEDNLVVYSNRTGVPTDVVLEARLSPFLVFPLCVNYSLDIVIAPETCLVGVDDGFENNDGCNSAIPLANGFYPGMHVEDTDVDYYRFRLPGQQALVIDALFQEELGDIDMTLTRSFSCGTVNSVASSTGYSDNERISYFNQSTETREYILAVYMKFGGGNVLGCYDLAVAGALDVNATSYCAVQPNSSGDSARIEILGSSTAADQDVFLRSSGLPANVPGLFFFGTSQIQVPFGDGLRCTGGMVQRIYPAAFAMGPAPAIAQRELNFSAPSSAPLVAGANLNFQFWFRDQMAGMAGFNLSNGVNLTFQ